MRKNKGIALLFVMMSLAMMAALAVGINQRWYSLFNRSAAHHATIEAKWQLMGAETIARQRLIDGLTAEEGESAWQQSQTLHTEEGDIQIEIGDAQACFNLNTLNYRFRPPEKSAESESTKQDKPSAEPPERRDIMRLIFSALLENLAFGASEKSEIINSIEARMAPENLALSDIAEFQALPGISPQAFARLQPYICVLPERKPAINLNALTQNQRPLLDALFLNQPASAEIRALIEARPAMGWKSINDPLLQKRLQALNSPESVSVLATKSRYFNITLSLENEKESYKLISLMAFKPPHLFVQERRLVYQGRE